MVRIHAVANQKGGVAKTTTAINLAASLAALGRRVLLVDLDPQANASSGLGVRNAPSPKSVYQLLVADDTDPRELLRPTEMKKLSLLPASRDLAAVEVELVDMAHREYRLRQALDKISGDFDDILLDCPPSLGLLTVNALCASHGALIPMQCEYFALEGISELVASLRRVKSFLNPGIEISGVLLTMYDNRTMLAKTVEADIRDFFKHRVFKTTIPRNVRLAEAPSFGKPAILYDIKSRGAEAYLQLAKEFVHDEKARQAQGAGQGA
jgi:chromosome partitioning protein